MPPRIGCAGKESPNCNCWCGARTPRRARSTSPSATTRLRSSSTPNGSTAASRRRNKVQGRPMTISDRIRVKDVRLLSDNHYTLKTTTFEWRRANGEWQTQARETYDCGNAAAILPYNLAQGTVVLVKQLRYSTYVNGYDDLLIEAAAGLLDGESPEKRIRSEAEEETGYRLDKIEKVFEAF